MSSHGIGSYSIVQKCFRMSHVLYNLSYRFHQRVRARARQDADSRANSVGGLISPHKCRGLFASLHSTGPAAINGDKVGLNVDQDKTCVFNENRSSWWGQ